MKVKVLTIISLLTDLLRPMNLKTLNLYRSLPEPFREPCCRTLQRLGITRPEVGLRIQKPPPLRVGFFLALFQLQVQREFLYQEEPVFGTWV